MRSCSTIGSVASDRGVVLSSLRDQLVVSKHGRPPGVFLFYCPGAKASTGKTFVKPPMLLKWILPVASATEISPTGVLNLVPLNDPKVACGCDKAELHNILQGQQPRWKSEFLHESHGFAEAIVMASPNVSTLLVVLLPKVHSLPMGIRHGSSSGGDHFCSNKENLGDALLVNQSSSKHMRTACMC